MYFIKRRMIAVAVLVCLFAVSMATLLNYFKYRATANRMDTGRLVVIGRGIENSIQASLALNIAFTDLDTLPAVMERERASDDLILDINVFDNDGKLLYSTDRQQMGKDVPAAWLAAVQRAGDADWYAEDASGNVVGISIKNNFGLTLGHLALRYSREKIDREAYNVAKGLVLNALLAFAGSAALASLALIFMMRPLARDIALLETALRPAGHAGSGKKADKGAFGPAVLRFLDMARMAEVQIATIRGQLGRRLR